MSKTFDSNLTNTQSITHCRISNHAFDYGCMALQTHTDTGTTRRLLIERHLCDPRNQSLDHLCYTPV